MTTIPVTTDKTAEVWDWPLEQNDGVVRVVNTADRFEVGLSVPYFTPKEIEVKVMNGDLMLHCYHEHNTDKNGVVKRELHRVYKLPQDVDSQTLRSHLNQDGVMQITARKK